MNLGYLATFVTECGSLDWGRALPDGGICKYNWSVLVFTVELNISTHKLHMSAYFVHCMQP